MSNLNQNLLQDYQAYNSSAQQQQSFPWEKPAVAAAGLTGSLPWVQAGLSGAGLLQSLYGGYKAQQDADRNYEMQKEEMERQRAIEEETRRQEEQQQALKNSYSAAQFSQGTDDRLLAKYKDYYRSVGI